MVFLCVCVCMYFYYLFMYYLYYLLLTCEKATYSTTLLRLFIDGIIHYSPVAYVAFIALTLQRLLLLLAVVMHQCCVGRDPPVRGGPPCVYKVLA